MTAPAASPIAEAWGSGPILFVSHWAGSGGAEKQLFEIIAHAHQALGLRCACVVPWKGSLYRNLRGIGVPCYAVPYRWWAGKDIPAWTRALRTLLNIPMTAVVAGIVLSTRAQLVYTSTFTVPVGALAAFVTGRPHVWHMHELFGENTFDLGEGFSTALMNRLSTTVVVGSSTVRESYRRFIPDSKIVQIENAVQVPESGGAPTAPVPGRLVSVGYLKPTKGHEDAIRAVRTLVDRGLDVSLHVIGATDDATYRDHLMQLVHELGLESRIHFTGQLAAPFDEMRAAEILLMCARDEAFGRVTVEAMLLERPVIGAASGATREIVADGQTGLLYPPGAIDRLADAIEALLREPERTQAMGRKGREKALREYGAARYFDAWMRTIASAVRRS